MRCCERSSSKSRGPQGARPPPQRGGLAAEAGEILPLPSRPQRFAVTLRNSLGPGPFAGTVCKGGQPWTVSGFRGTERGRPVQGSPRDTPWCITNPREVGSTSHPLPLGKPETGLEDAGRFPKLGHQSPPFGDIGLGVEPPRLQESNQTQGKAREGGASGHSPCGHLGHSRPAALGGAEMPSVRPGPSTLHTLQPRPPGNRRPAL